MSWINVRDVHPGGGEESMWTEYALRGIPTMILIDGETGAIILRDGTQDMAQVLAALLQ